MKTEQATLKLSEAIRKGAATGVEKARRSLLVLDGDGKVEAACALGAAYLGSVSRTPRNTHDYVGLEARFPELLGRVPVARLPEGFPPVSHDPQLEEVVWTLNDTLLYTFAQVADYLEGIGY
jgi:hypothetical protein